MQGFNKSAPQTAVFIVNTKVASGGTTGGLKAAYDYRAFGEQIELTSPSTGKVTENFTGKEHDDEIALDNFGAHYLDPMFGMWTSVDPMRQFASPYLYAGNGMNPVNIVDQDGNAAIIQKNGNKINVTIPIIFSGEAATPSNIKKVTNWIAKNLSGKYGKYNVKTAVVKYDIKKHGITYNIVKLSDGPSSQCVRGSCAKPANMFPNLAYMDVNSEYTVTHETAHLIGLDDKYYRDPDKTFMKYNLHTPYPGYDDNLMGGHGGFDLKEQQIEEMWGPGRSDFNDVELSNRYKANDIREVK